MVKPRAVPKDRCEAITKDGRTRCTLPKLPGKRRCWQHTADPEISQERAIARFKGGVSARLATVGKDQVPEVNFASLAKVQRLMEKLLIMTLTGEISSNVARAAKGFLDSNIALAQLSIADRLAKIEERLSKDLGIDLEHEE